MKKCKFKGCNTTLNYWNEENDEFCHLHQGKALQISESMYHPDQKYYKKIIDKSPKRYKKPKLLESTYDPTLYAS